MMPDFQTTRLESEKILLIKKMPKVKLRISELAMATAL